MRPDEWWFNVGSGIAPRPLEDREEHTKRVALAAYKSGSKDKK